MRFQQAKKLYKELRNGTRKRLPNGFWNAVGKEGACALLRSALTDLGLSQAQIPEQYNRRLLVKIKLNSAAQVIFNNNHTEFLETAFPEFRGQFIGSRRAQVEKDESYFDCIDTEEKAYLLGLLAADGNVTDTNQISLWVQRDDRPLVDLFATALKLNPYRPKHRKRDGTWGVVVCSATLARALARHGIVPRKSCTLRWPTTVPETMVRHYMRGLLDGDGSVSEVQWTFTSGSECFVREYRRRAEEVVGVELPLNRVGKGKRNWLVTGGRNTWVFLDWLYYDATLFHEGKHARYLGGKRDIPQLMPIRPRNRRKTGRRGDSVEVHCSLCGAQLRVAESRTKHTRYLFCDACKAEHEHSIQTLIKNQGPTAGTSPKREKLIDSELKRNLKALQRRSGGRLPTTPEIRRLLGEEVIRALRARGGLRAVADRWNLVTAIQAPGRFDALEDLLAELDGVVNELGHFPAESALRRLKRYDLVNAIQKKHGGIRKVRSAWNHRAQRHI